MRTLILAAIAILNLKPVYGLSKEAANAEIKIRMSRYVDLNRRADSLVQVGRQQKAKCDQLADSAAVRSCDGMLNPSRQTYRRMRDSLTQILAGIDSLANRADTVIPDTNRYELNDRRPFQVFFSAAYAPYVYDLISVSQEGRIQRLGRDGKRADFPYIKFKCEQSDMLSHLVLEKIVADSLLLLSSSYWNDIQDGEVWTLKVAQDGWVKSVHLSNYRPENVRRFYTFLQRHCQERDTSDAGAEMEFVRLDDQMRETGTLLHTPSRHPRGAKGRAPANSK